MKKTAAKTAAAKPDKPVVKAVASDKKAAAAKPAAAKASKAAAPKVPKASKVSKTPKVVSAAPAVKPAKSSPQAKAKPSAVTTTIVAAIDVGFGNHLTLRGDGPGLSWEAGVPLECLSDDRWSITLPETTQPIICKFLLNDTTWSAGEDYTILPGSSVVLSPIF